MSILPYLDEWMRAALREPSYASYLEDIFNGETEEDDVILGFFCLADGVEFY